MTANSSISSIPPIGPTTGMTSLPGGPGTPGGGPFKPIDPLRVLRRHVWLLVALVIVGIAAGVGVWYLMSADARATPRPPRSRSRLATPRSGAA